MKNKSILFIFTYTAAAIIPAVAQSNIDASFVSDLPAGSTIWAMSVQADEKIIVGGKFNTVGGLARRSVARLNANGTVDPAFNSRLGVGGDDPTVYAVATDPSTGKVYIGGTFSHYGEKLRPGIARLNADGSLDTTFTPGTGVSGFLSQSRDASGVYSIARQTDGKIVIGGQFSQYNGASRNRIARLFSNGAVDTAFDPGSGVTLQPQTTSGPVTSFAGVYSISIAADGSYIVGGSFNTVGLQNHPGVAHLSATGATDESYYTLEQPSDVYTTVLQADGKALVGKTIGGSGNGLIRLTTTGAIDSSYNLGTNTLYAVYGLALQTDGKAIVLADGPFDGSYVHRRNVDGSFDKTLVSSANGGFIASVALDQNGLLLVSGTFTNVNGVAANAIARVVTSSPAPAPLLQKAKIANQAFSVDVPTSNGATYTLEAKTDLANPTWTPRASMVGDGKTNTVTDPDPLVPRKFYRVRAE